MRAPRPIVAIIISLVLLSACAHQGSFRFKKFMPLSEAECEKAGGSWWSPGMPGNRNPKVCDLPTSDAGRACRDSEECEGYCLSDATPILKIFVRGQCSKFQHIVGCQGVVVRGRVATTCVD